jgi:NAD(P)-dependent dehydrogenase (short-subunit alcohol dehydrogenase family)
MAHYMILGNGGIGRALTQQLQQQQHNITVISRHRPAEAGFDHLQLDLTQPEAVTPLTDYLREHWPDSIINTIGFLHDENLRPEKHSNELTEAALTKSVHINVMPAVHLVKSLNPLLRRSTHLQVVNLSARLASLNDNQVGGWYSYRMSKVALNMFIRNVQIEWRRNAPNAAIYGYQPGTVDTPLSKPFQSRIAKQHIFTPAQAASYLLTTLGNLKKEEGGNVFDWQGKMLAF